VLSAAEVLDIELQPRACGALDAALDGLQYLPGSDYAGIDTLNLAIADAGQTVPAAVSIGVAAVVQPPLLTPSTSVLYYNASSGAAAIDSAITLADAGASNITGATVSISPGYAEDSLLFDTQNGISGDYDNTTGILTLTGKATVSQYEAALQSITYQDSSSNYELQNGTGRLCRKP
jgi:hypothetical protein